jgi:hypothetical protein
MKTIEPIARLPIVASNNDKLIEILEKTVYNDTQRYLLEFYEHVIDLVIAGRERKLTTADITDTLHIFTVDKKLLDLSTDDLTDLFKIMYSSVTFLFSNVPEDFRVKEYYVSAVYASEIIISK